MIQQFMETHKRAVTITLIIIAIAIVGSIITVFALNNAPKDKDVAVVSGTSSATSSEPAVSVPTISVPEIKKPEPLPISSAPASSQPTSSAAASSAPISSQVKVDVTASVDQKPAATSPMPPAASKPAPSAAESKPQTPPEGDLIPKPNTNFTKPANRNMPSFTVDSSVSGPQGYHGQIGPCDTINCGCSGTHYYHAGCDTWMADEYWFAYRYGQHPEATDYLNYAPQVSPYQQDGDYNPFNAGIEPGSGCYYCKACNGWIDSTAWENGQHGSGKTHISNTKKIG